MSAFERLSFPGAELTWCPSFLDPLEASSLFDALLDEVPWSVHRIRMFGRWVDSPRRSCWMGDGEARYRYSGAVFEPVPWHPQLADLRSRLEAACSAGFNSVLLNHYRHGGDYMGWHSDDERELGPRPVIASLSLGATRRFRLRRRDDHRLSADIPLSHGSLLVMAGDTQRLTQHALPKQAGAGGRINLTFRCVRIDSPTSRSMGG